MSVCEKERERERRKREEREREERKKERERRKRERKRRKRERRREREVLLCRDISILLSFFLPHLFYREHLEMQNLTSHHPAGRNQGLYGLLFVSSSKTELILQL